MGNRSLGDYFKKEAVNWSWEFLVDVLWFDKGKLAATVFEGDEDTPRDEETAGYRKAYLPEHKIVYLSVTNNWWSPGPVWPCGPDTEIFYWVGSSEYPPESSNPGTDEDNRLEIWNNVFMQFYRDESGKLTLLENKNVDTGMWFERMCTVLQGKESVYETDVFSSLLDIVVKYVWPSYLGNERRYRIVADHLRTAFFLVKDGILPSNEGRGYVLRRLIRRMYYNIILLNTVDQKKFTSFLKDVIEEIVSLFEISGDFSGTLDVLEKEVLQFQKTITNWQKLLQDVMKWATKKIISGQDTFKLYDTFGFPLELTKEIAMDAWFSVDEEGFLKEMTQQQQRSRAWSKDMFKQDTDWSTYIAGIPATKFVGYDTMNLDTMQLLKDFDVNGQRILIFDQTPFYANSGGQNADIGYITLEGGEQFLVTDVKKYEGVFLHFVG